MSHKILTQNEIIDMLKKRKGASFVSVTTSTTPQMKKTNNPYFGKVKRICRRQGMIGPDYERCVNTQREREEKTPDFLAEPLRWGQHDGPYFITYNGRTYLKLKEHGHGDDRWVDAETGSVIDVSVLQQYFYAKSEGRQGLDKPVEWRTVRMDHLVSLSVDGLVVEVIHG
jgi:hypothetical protein